MRAIEQQTQSAGAAGMAGYQGQVFPINHRGKPLMVKAAYGFGPMRWLREYMLRREHRVYERLQGFEGAPHCLGLIGGRYLVLERIPGEILRQADIRDREKFFATLFKHIEELHRRGVAHADLKRKDNLLVVAGNHPCLIDFGTAVIRQRGFHPFNHFLFRVAKQFDYNAWVKHKHRYIEHAPPQDLAYYRLTRTERMARGVKRRYLAAKNRIGKRR